MADTSRFDFCEKCGALSRDGMCQSCGHVDPNYQPPKQETEEVKGVYSQQINEVSRQQFNTYQKPAKSSGVMIIIILALVILSMFHTCGVGIFSVAIMKVLTER